MVAPGNPLGIAGVPDLTRPGVRDGPRDTDDAEDDPPGPAAAHGEAEVFGLPWLEDDRRAMCVVRPA